MRVSPDQRSDDAVQVAASPKRGNMLGDEECRDANELAVDDVQHIDREGPKLGLAGFAKIVRGSGLDGSLVWRPAGTRTRRAGRRSHRRTRQRPRRRRSESDRGAWRFECHRGVAPRCCRRHHGDGPCATAPTATAANNATVATISTPLRLHLSASSPDGISNSGTTTAYTPAISPTLAGVNPISDMNSFSTGTHNIIPCNNVANRNGRKRRCTAAAEAAGPVDDARRMSKSSM